MILKAAYDVNRSATPKFSELKARSIRKNYFAQSPRRYVLEIGRNASLELTLAEYGVIPTEATVAKIGGSYE